MKGEPRLCCIWEAINRQRDELEQERRQIAAERVRAPIVAEAVKFVGGLIVCALPLVVVIYLLHSLRNSNDETDSVMIEVLVEELVTGRRSLLPAGRQVPALPSSASEHDDDASIMP